MDDPLLGAGSGNFDVQAAAEGGKAPIELMSQFLVLVSNRKMKEAGQLCEEILVFEPDNKMIKNYRKSINEFIAQGLDEEEDEDDDTKEEDSSDDEKSDASADSKSESDDDQQEEKKAYKK